MAAAEYIKSKYPQFTYVRSPETGTDFISRQNVIKSGPYPVIFFAKFVREAQLPECSCAVEKSNGHGIAYIFI